LAYLGGKNGIYRYIKSLDGRQERKIFIDVDINGAYARSLSLLPVINWEGRFKRSFSAGEYAMAKAQLYNEKLEQYKIELYSTDFNFPKDVYDPVLPQKTP